MPAFFIVAGYLAALLLERRKPFTWLKGRYVRLGIPLVACMILVAPVQTFSATFDDPAVHFAPDLAWKAARRSLSTQSYEWVHHLWFLIALLYYCSLAAAGTYLFPRLQSWRVTSPGSRSFSVAAPLLSAGVAIALYQIAGEIALRRLGLNTGTASGLFTLTRAQKYAPFFFLGCFLQRHDAYLEAFTHICRLTSSIAAISVGITLWLSLTTTRASLNRLWPAVPLSHRHR